MRKQLSFAVLAMCCAISFISCNDDDDAPYVPKPVEISSGAFIVNSGNMSSQISSSITSVDYSAWNASQKVFQTANGRNLGATANDAIVYGDKMYIVVTDENTIEIVNKNTMLSVGTIKTETAMGSDKGTQPRRLAAGNGMVYVSTFAGYVAAIDTTTLAVKNTYQAGSYPEGLAVDGNMLYVANSDYSRGTNPSISYINLQDGSKTELKDPLITNPVGITVINGELYVLDSGMYDASYNQTDAGVRKITSDKKVTKIIDATMMAADKSDIYVVNAPFAMTPVIPTFGVYNTVSGEEKTFTGTSLPFSPSAIGVDPVNDYVFITSYSKDPDTGFAGYNIDGYMNVYKKDGTFFNTFATGVGPAAVTFNTGISYE